MKAKKLVLLLDAIVVAIIAMVMITGTAITKTGVAKQQKLMAGNADLSFNLIASPEEKRVKAGETVEITLSAKDIKIGEEGLNSIVGYLGYNESLFDSMKIEGVGNWKIELNQIKDHDLYGKFCIYTMDEGVTENQDVVKITLKLKDDLKPQTTKVTFTSLASSDGDVEVPEEDREVTIIIYEDEVPPTPVDPEPEPEPEPQPEPTPEPVQTGDTKTLVVLAIAILTIILNVLTFAKGKKGKILSTILVMLIGLSCLGIVSYANDEINVAEVLNRLSIKQNWLNSDKYLVTEENVSRIAPGAKVENVANLFNKEITVTKNGEAVTEGTIGTGMKISVKNPTAADAEGDYAYEVSVWGDTNGDGKSNQVELTRIIRNVIDDEKWNLTGVLFKSADLTVDNQITEDDVTKSVRYIVYGEMEIPEFDPVEEPSIEVVEGTFDEEENCYTTNVKVSITENASNGIKTQYKVENSKGEQVPYTEISREEANEDGKYEAVIELEKGEIYKISAYTTGELGNRSEIPYIIVNGVYNNLRKYIVEYYYTGLNDEEPKLVETAVHYADIRTQITTYEDKNKEGYELDTTKGTNGVVGLPLTIDKNEESNIIKVYYKIINYTIEYQLNDGTLEDGKVNPTTYTIETPDITLNNPVKENNNFEGWTGTGLTEKTTEVTIPQGSTGNREYTANWTEIVTYLVKGLVIGGNGSINGVPQEVVDGGATEEIKVIPDAGYTVDTLKLYSGNEIAGEYPAEDADGQNWNKYKSGKLYTIKDIHEKKLIVVKFKQAIMVAKIVALPGDNDERLNIESSIDGKLVLDHEYESLEDALEDARRVNEKRDQLKIDEPNLEGKVEIRLIADIDDEINTVEKGNDVILDLNSKTLSGSDSEKSILTIQQNASLQVLDRTEDQTGKIINNDGTAIKININGDLILGENGNDQPSITSPVIQGTTSAVNNIQSGEDSGTFEFYDGKLISDTENVLTGSPKVITPDFYEVTKTTEGTQHVLILQTISGYQAKIGQTPYTTLVQAVETVNRNTDYTAETPVQIDLIAEETIMLNKEEGGVERSSAAENYACYVAAGKNIILNLNGRTIDHNELNTNMFYVENGSTMKIIDTTSNEDSTENYAQLENLDDNYYFVKGNNYIEPNNMETKNTQAKSRIAIDLSEESAEEDFELALDYYCNNGLYAIVTTSETYPTTVNNEDYIINSDNAQDLGNKTATKTLKGGSKYYLYLNYTNNDILNHARIYGITLNGKNIIKEVLKPTGQILNVGGGMSGEGTIILDGAILNIGTSTSGFSSKFIMESGIIEGDWKNTGSGKDVILKDGIINGSIIERNPNKTITVQNKILISGQLICENLAGNGGIVFGATAKANISNCKILSEMTSKNNTEISNSKIRKLITNQIINNQDMSEGTDSNASIDISGTYISGTYISELKAEGDVKIENCNIGKIDASNANEETNIQLVSGTVNSSDIAIKTNNLTTLTLGTKNTTLAAPDITKPEIKGLTKGISGNCTVKFYDGVVISPKGTQFENVTNMETEEQNENGTQLIVVYSEKYTEDGVELQKAYLGISLEKCARINSNTAGLDVSGLSTDEWTLDQDGYYYFTSLKSAINACASNAGNSVSTIELIDNISQINNIAISYGKNIEIDLNGCNIEATSITNGGTLSISDDSTTKGNIKCPIVNNGTATINNGKFTGIITNNNIMTIEGGEFSKQITNQRVLVMNGGTVNAYAEVGIKNESNSKFVEDESEASLYITGGSINAINSTGNGDVIIKQANNSTVTCGIITMQPEDKGKLNIDGGTYTTIYNRANSTAVIKNIIGTEQNASSIENEGIIVIEDSTLTGVSNKSADAEMTIKGETTTNAVSNKGKLTIPSSAKVTIAVMENRKTGKLYLGTSGVEPSTENIKVQGLTVGIYNSGELYFNDGVIIGNKNMSIVNEITNEGSGQIRLSSNIEMVTEDDIEENREKTYLRVKEPVVSIIKNEVDTESENFENVNNYLDTENNCYCFYSIEDAAKVSKTNATIYLNRNITLSSSETDEIIEGATVKLDLNGHVLTYTGETGITNNGTLTIIDSSTASTERLKSTGTNIILNNGTVTLDGGVYNDNVNVINNNEGGTATITNNAQVYKVLNKGTMNIENSDIYLVSNEENGHVTIKDCSSFINNKVEVTNNSNSTNTDAGVKIEGTLTGDLYVTNTAGIANIVADNKGDIKIKTVSNEESGTMLIEKVTYNNAYSGYSTVTNKGKVTIKNSDIGNVSDANTSDGVNFESGTIKWLNASTGTKVGKEGSDVTSTDAQVLIDATGNLTFNSGVINLDTSEDDTDAFKSGITIPDSAELVYTKGTTQDTYTLIPAEDVAQIVGTTQKFKSLKLAVDYANENYINGENVEIKLLKDVFVTTGREAEIRENQNITLNLNGNVLYNKTNNNSINNKGKLKVIDGSSSKTGKMINSIESDKNSYIIKNEGKLELSDVKVLAANTNSILNSTDKELKIISGKHKGIIYTDGTGEININDVETYGENEMINGIWLKTPYNQVDVDSSAIGNINIINSKMSIISVQNAHVKIKQKSVVEYSINGYKGGTYEESESTQYKTFIEVDDSTINGMIEIGTNAKLNITNNSQIKNTISNGGIVNIENSTVQTSNVNANNSMITNGGELNIENSTLEYTGNNRAIYLCGGRATIKNSTVSSSGGIGIYMEQPNYQYDATETVELILGDKNTSVETETPVIQGGKDGIYQKGDFVLIYFYDGVIKGKNNSINVSSGRIKISDDLPNFYEVGATTDGDYKVSMLRLKGDYLEVASIGSIKYNIFEIQNAINYAAANNSKINIEKSFEITETLNIPENENVKIDLKGNTLSGNIAGGLINNNGTLTITDSKETGTKGKIINNTGTPAITGNAPTVDPGIEITE